jgi:hypothetical protein
VFGRTIEVIVGLVKLLPEPAGLTVIAGHLSLLKLLLQPFDPFVMLIVHLFRFA